MPGKLPSGWTKATLSDIVRPGRSRVSPRDHPDLPYIGLGHIESQSMRLLSKGDASDVRSSSILFEKGDVLYGKMRPYLNKVWVAEFAGMCSAEFLVFPHTEELNSTFFALRLNADDFVNFANQQMSGDRPRADFKGLSSFQILLPPLAEQGRIVATLNESLTRMHASESATQRGSQRLVKYRAAVLRAAVIGELTRDWRKTHKLDEIGLQRLLKARRIRWEEAELQRLCAASKPPKDDAWKLRYREPKPPRSEGLPTLPNGWTWASLDQLGELSRGKSKHRPRDDARLYDGPYPFIQTGDIRKSGGTIREHTQTYSEFGLKQSQLWPAGTLCITIAANIAETGILSYPACFPDSVVGFVQDDSLLKVRFVEFFIRAERSKLERYAPATAQKNINLELLEGLAVPLPPLDEQLEIIREAERRLSAANRLAVTLNDQLVRARATRQSLLSQAFAGRLVTQYPNDEPASVLLDRICVAREAEAKKPKAQRMPRKFRKKQPSIELPAQISGKAIKSPEIEPVVSVAASTIPRQIKLLRLKLYQDFNSLKASEFALRSVGKAGIRLSPICLVGLNGSGKSNLIEALSEILCHIELSLLPWKSITSKQRVIDLCFDLEYQLFKPGSTKPTRVRLEKPGQSPVVFKILHEAKEEIVTDSAECMSLLPTRVIGYSSGLNETISIPYFRTAAIYSEEVLKQAKREKEQPLAELPDVPDSRTFFMDYECNALVLVANFLLQPKSRLQLFRKNLRIDSLNSFDIRYRPTYQGNKPVELTRELKSYINAIRESADTVQLLEDNVTEVFRFVDPTGAAPRIKRAFHSANNFFRALYKLSLLNPLALTGRKRKFFLREDTRAGQLERPPTISREDRIFSIDHIRLNLTKPKRAIDYAAISDGEHQFLQVFGSAILFDQPGCVFLLDEPETHFNPQWRRLSIQWLANISSTVRQELMISTHSPFVVSGCRGEQVFKFKREGDFSVCSKLGIETFGASYDFLLARLFELKTMISEQAIEEMREVIKSTSIEKVRDAIPHFGESFEKRFLFERIAQLQQKKKRKR